MTDSERQAEQRLSGVKARLSDACRAVLAADPDATSLVVMAQAEVAAARAAVRQLDEGDNT